MPPSSKPTKASRLRRCVTALTAAALVLSGLTACQDPTPQLLIIAATGTANEPQPALSQQDTTQLQTEIDTDNATTEFTTTTGTGQATPVSPALDLRLLRDGEIENDQTLRTQKSAALMTQINQRLAAITPDTPDLDLLTVLTAAGNHPGPAAIIVISSGMQTRDPLNLRTLGWDFSVARVVDDLAARGLLPTLIGKTVTFSGLGDVAGAQTPLPQPLRTQLQTLWLTICQHAGAANCAIDGAPAVGGPPTATTTVPTVLIPPTDTHTGLVDPPPATTGTPIQWPLPASVLFQPDSAQLQSGAADALAPVAAKIQALNATVQLSGHVWKTGPDDDPAQAKTLSLDRAHTVADQLITLGVPADRITTVDGVGFDEPITPDGQTDPQQIAAANRVVIATLIPAH